MHFTFKGLDGVTATCGDFPSVCCMGGTLEEVWSSGGDVGPLADNSSVAVYIFISNI